jgi:hypothetical protein
MLKIYTASHPIHAHALRGALGAAGIEAEVRGDFLFSMRGELPFTTDTLPSVWILHDEDLELAQTVMREFERGSGDGSIGTWKCECGEINERQFDRCWKCGRAENL